MEHCTFAPGTWAATTLEADGTDITVSVRCAQAADDLAWSCPQASATWHGVTLGTPARDGSRDNVLDGDATLALYLQDLALDRNFTSVVHLDRNSAHTMHDVRLNDVPVAADGSRRASALGIPILGGFKGPDHEESGGVFQRRGFAGTFGAKLQASTWRHEPGRGRPSSEPARECRKGTVDETRATGTNLHTGAGHCRHAQLGCCKRSLVWPCSPQGTDVSCSAWTSRNRPQRFANANIAAAARCTGSARPGARCLPVAGRTAARPSATASCECLGASDHLFGHNAATRASCDVQT